MRHWSALLIVAASLAFLNACSSDSSTDPCSEDPSSAPAVTLKSDFSYGNFQTVFRLDASGSEDPDCDSRQLSYRWDTVQRAVSGCSRLRGIAGSPQASAQRGRGQRRHIIVSVCLGGHPGVRGPSAKCLLLPPTSVNTLATAVAAARWGRMWSGPIC